MTSRLPKRSQSRIPNKEKVYEIPLYLDTDGNVSKTSLKRFQMMLQLVSGVSANKFETNIKPFILNTIATSGSGPHYMTLTHAPKPGNFRYVYFVARR
jgi:hypothetical protein